MTVSQLEPGRPRARPSSLLTLTSYLAGNAAKIGQQGLLDALAAHRLRLRDHVVLAALTDYGPLAPNEIAAALRNDRSHVSAAIDVLARRGLVERRPDTADRRRLTVHLTDAGEALFHSVDAAARVGQTALTGRLDDGELEQLRALLLKALGGDFCVEAH